MSARLDFSFDEGCEPIGSLRFQGVVGEIGPGVVAFGLAQKENAVAPLVERFCPGQFVESKFRDAFGEDFCGLRHLRCR